MSNNEEQRWERLTALGFKREISTPEGEPKMSDVILKLVEPLLNEYGTTPDRATSLISLAVAGWNQAMFPADKQPVIEKELVDCFVPKDGMAEDVGVIVQVMDLIANRREKLYPNLRKVIVSFDVNIADGNLNLKVSSAPIPDLGNNVK